MTVQQDGFDDLLARLNEPRAESHKFTRQGEVLAGTVAKLDTGTTRDGDRVRIVVIDTGEKLCSVWLLHDALAGQMQKLRPTVGDRVAIRYNGRETSQAGRSYHSYTVVGERQEPAFSWDDGQSARTSAGTAEPASPEGDDLYPAEPNPFHDEPLY